MQEGRNDEILHRTASLEDPRNDVFLPKWGLLLFADLPAARYVSEPFLQLWKPLRVKPEASKEGRLEPSDGVGLGEQIVSELPLIDHGMFYIRELQGARVSERITMCISCEPSWRGPCASTGRDRLDRQLHALVIRRRDLQVFRL